MLFCVFVTQSACVLNTHPVDDRIEELGHILKINEDEPKENF
jgi:hypothetical protein